MSRLLLALGLCFLCAPARAQESASILLSRALLALDLDPTLAADYRIKIDVTLPDSRREVNLDGEITLDFATPQPRIRIAESGGPLSGFDGETFWQVNPEEQWVLVDSLGADLVGRVLAFQMLEGHPLLLDPGDRALLPVRAERLSHPGSAEVGGVPCERIRVDFEPEDPSLLESIVEWCFPAGSGLPVRHWHRIVTAEATVEITADFSNVRSGPFPPDLFATSAVPEDFETTILGRRDYTARLPAGIAPDFVLLDSEGIPVRLSDLQGSPVLIDFWGVWCPQCVEALPRLQEIHERYGPRGLVILGVNAYDEPDSDPVAFARSRGVTFRLLTSGESVARAYRVFGFPSYILLDEDGYVYFRAAEDDNEDLYEELEEAIEELLAE